MKTVGIVLAVLIGAIALVGFIAPKEMKVDRSIVIDAAPEKVYPYISTFEQTNRWQPWMQLDPNMET
ncbi:MAG: SRPBCC family protein, partial [Bacteroidota bacterium]